MLQRINYIARIGILHNIYIYIYISIYLIIILYNTHVIYSLAIYAYAYSACFSICIFYIILSTYFVTSSAFDAEMQNRIL